MKKKWRELIDDRTIKEKWLDDSVFYHKNRVNPKKFVGDCFTQIYTTSSKPRVKFSFFVRPNHLASRSASHKAIAPNVNDGLAGGLNGKMERSHT